LGIDLLHSMFLLECQVLNVQSVDTIDHGLHKLDFRVAETMFVGNIVGHTSLAARFTTGATGLEGKGFAPGLQGGNTLLGPAGEVDVDRGPHAGTQVGGARVQVAQFLVEHELLAGFGPDRVTNSLDTTSQPFENTSDITTFLHRDDPKLIFFIDPDKESLGSVVENTATFRPIPLHTSGDQVLVAGDEKEMIIDQLLSVGFSHAQKRVVLAGKISRQFGEWDFIKSSMANL